MKKGRKEVLEANGWKVYDTAWEAVGMSSAEAELAETKFQMARRIKELRSAKGYTQAQFSKKLGTSQPYVAALEKSSGVTLDSLFQAFRLLGGSAREFGKMFGMKVRSAG